MLKHNDIKREKKAERFDMFLAVTEKKIKIEEKKVELVANSNNAKMLTLKMEDLEPDATKIVQAYHARMFKRLAVELEEPAVEE
ncbi:hypothetical protein D1007_01042 [Hordeum vulgare]|nr:hypothetical protein D1007_01042 [Hordeum vulgare]